MEKKYFQYLQGENQGKVVELVDLVHDTIGEGEDITLMKFNDGNCCNIDFIGQLNDNTAYNSGKFMAEVYSPDNIWTFNKKDNRTEIRQAIDKNGNLQTGVDPYNDPDGVGKQGRIIITATPPKRVFLKSRMKTSADKLKEFGISAVIAGYNDVALTVDSNELIQTHKANSEYIKATSYGHVELDGTTAGFLDSASIKPASETDRKRFNMEDGEYIIIDDDTSDLKANDVVSIDSKNIENESVEKQKINNQIQEVKPVEKFVEKSTTEFKNKNDKFNSSPIYSIVSKCKKKQVSANLKLDLQLPGKGIYNLIKDEYDEDSLDEFFDIIISEISTEQIKKSLKSALVASYNDNNEA